MLFKKSPRNIKVTKIQLTNEEVGKLLVLLFFWDQETDTSSEDQQLLAKAFKSTAQAGTAEYLFCCLAVLEIHNRLHTNSGYNFLDVLPMIKFVGNTFFGPAACYNLNLSGSDVKITQQWACEKDRDYAEVNLNELVSRTRSLLSQQFYSYFPKNTQQGMPINVQLKVELHPKILNNYYDLLQRFTQAHFSFPCDYKLSESEVFLYTESHQLLAT